MPISMEHHASAKKDTFSSMEYALDALRTLIIIPLLGLVFAIQDIISLGLKSSKFPSNHKLEYPPAIPTHKESQDILKDPSTTLNLL